MITFLRGKRAPAWPPNGIAVACGVMPPAAPPPPSPPYGKESLLAFAKLAMSVICVLSWRCRGEGGIGEAAPSAAAKTVDPPEYGWEAPRTGLLAREVLLARPLGCWTPFVS